MIELRINRVSLRAPGLEGWPQACAVLAGKRSYDPSARAPPDTRWLPPALRRRVSPTTALALQAAREAVHGHDTRAMPAVFASADGDLDTDDQLCRSLAETPPWASPTRVQNSVHNAAAGYWSIATGARIHTTTLAAGAGTAASALQAAACELAVDEPAGLLLVLYDAPGPEPLARAHPTTGPFACGLWLTPMHGPGRALRLSRASGADSELADTGLDALRRGNPAARVLPLLEALAGPAAAVVQLNGHCGGLHLELAAQARR